MTPKTIAVTVDNPRRDLPGLVLLSLTLVSRGHTVLLVPVNIMSDAWPGEPDFFLLGYHRRNNDYQVRRIVRCGLPFAILDTEGGAINLDQFTGSMSLDDGLRRSAAAVCMWGPKLADHLVRGGFYGQEQVKVTGCPRMDFYHPLLAESARERSRGTWAGDSGFILVIGSSPVGNPKFLSYEKNLESFIESSGLDRERCAALQKEQADHLREMLSLTGRLAAEFPDRRIVLRPHPFENERPYQEVEHEHPNVTLVQGGTVDGLLLRACCTVQRTGSTAIEAALAGIPALSPHWIPVQSTFIPETDSVLDACADFAELALKVGRAAGREYRRPPQIQANIDRTVADLFFRNDGRAHVRVADVLEGILDALHGSEAGGQGWQRIRGLGARLARRKELQAWTASAKHFDVDSVQAVIREIQRFAPPEFPHLKAPVALSNPPAPLARFEAFQVRSVKLTPS